MSRKSPANLNIFHLLDFSYKLCNCCRNIQLLGSTFNQEGEHMNGLYDPVSDIGDGVFAFDILI
mgnify:CR=1 FL=1